MAETYKYRGKLVLGLLLTSSLVVTNELAVLSSSQNTVEAVRVLVLR